jgi:LysM repeat protein
MAGPVEGQRLQGSQASLDVQNEQARLHDYSFIRTASQVRGFVEQAYLVPIVPTSDFELYQVSFPYARPEVRTFVQRLAGQYRASCGEKLVVTSLTRPLSAQPVNASERSVHPTGMAIDLRRSSNSKCRAWLEQVLLSLEAEGVVEATLERNPPHYHVAVFPRPYLQYVQALTGGPEILADRSPADAPVEVALVTHSVRRGETLSEIAERYGTSVARVRAENDLRGDVVLAGQALQVPASASASRGEMETVRVAAASPGAQTAQDAGEAIQEASHRVGAGESLWTIARRYGVSEDLLRAANGIRGSRILVGQELRVPLAADGTGVLRYTVRSGDSLWVIANRLGTTVDQIRERNEMDVTRIYAGQVLDVPLSR